MAKGPSQNLFKRALVVLLIFTIIGFGATGYGLVNTIIIHGKEYAEKAEQQQLQDIVTKAKRGNIYDRNMNVLATSATVWQVYAAPSSIKEEDKPLIAEELSKLLDLKSEKVRELLDKNTSYQNIGSPVEQETATKIREFISNNELGAVIGLSETNERYYPNDSLASTVLGFVGTDNQGLGGIEAQYDSQLTGTEGRVVAKLEAEGKVRAVITQNIDGLHQMAGSREVLELHGSVHRNYCENCGKFFDAQYILDSKDVPVCDESSCGGGVKPDVVLYEEGLDDETIRKSIEYIKNADVLIVGGTSLAVYPAAGLIDYYSGDKLILINKSATPRDSVADYIYQGSLSDVFSKL